MVRPLYGSLVVKGLIYCLSLLQFVQLYPVYGLVTQARSVHGILKGKRLGKPIGIWENKPSNTNVNRRFTNKVPTSWRTQCFCIKKNNRWPVYGNSRCLSYNYADHINTLCWQSAEPLDAKRGCICSYYFASKDSYSWGCINITVFWVVTPCYLFGKYYSFRNYCVHSQGIRDCITVIEENCLWSFRWIKVALHCFSDNLWC